MKGIIPQHRAWSAIVQKYLTTPVYNQCFSLDTPAQEAHESLGLHEIAPEEIWWFMEHTQQGHA